MRITLRSLIITLVVGAVAAALIWAVLPRPIPVETAVVTKGRFVATVDEDGKNSHPRALYLSLIHI